MAMINSDLLEISRRLLLKYYPVWLLMIILSDLAYATMALGIETRVSWIRLFVTDNLVSVFIFLFVIISLYTIKPRKAPAKFMVMSVSMFISVSIAVFIIGSLATFPPIPFSGVDQATSLFVGYLVSGTCIAWFIDIEEKQYAAEKRIASERIKRALNEKKVTEIQLRLLQARIEPHFLFNTLTSIVSLGQKSPRKAKVMQTHLTDYLRTTLDKTRSSITTISQEIELIRAYLEIFKVRMGKRLRYTIEMEDGISSFPFPSMLIQPVVENSIKHGLEPRIDGGDISLRVERAGEGRIRWEVADTGCGLSDKVALGTGLSNVMERVESLYGRDGQFVLEENRPTGLKVVLEVPHA